MPKPCNHAEEVKLGFGGCCVDCGMTPSEIIQELQDRIEDYQTFWPVANRVILTVIDVRRIVHNGRLQAAIDDYLRTANPFKTHKEVEDGPIANTRA